MSDKQRTKRSGERLPPVNGNKRNAGADSVRVVGKLLERRLYAVECLCAGCQAKVIAELPAPVAKRYSQGVEVPIECEACGQRNDVGKSLVMS